MYCFGMQHVSIYHQQHFNSFLEVYSTPNNYRALGITDKLVTGPYWRKCETFQNILDLNPVIKDMQRNCLQ